MNKTIVCDNCGHEGCGVRQVIPESEKISMKDFARRGKSPYSEGSYVHRQIDRTWIITCPECEHKEQYIERAPCIGPNFG